VLEDGHHRLGGAQFAPEVNDQAVASSARIASKILIDGCAPILHNDMNPGILIFGSFKYLNAVMMLVIAAAAWTQKFRTVATFWRVKGWLHCIGSLKLTNSGCLSADRSGVNRHWYDWRTFRGHLKPNSLSSAAFEVTLVFAAAKMGGRSNVRCNDLLGADLN
jgi:hypothetical protein